MVFSISSSVLKKDLQKNILLCVSQMQCIDLLNKWVIVINVTFRK
jgi:hypothetical protein